MPIPQVSVFLDNRPGSLSEVMSYLDKSQIKIYALTIAEAGEYGVVRMVVEDPEKISQILEDASFNLAKAKKNTEVTAVLITKENHISKITQILSDNHVNIEYAYLSAIHYEKNAAIIIRPKDIEQAEKAFKTNKIETLTLADIKQHFS